MEEPDDRSPYWSTLNNKSFSKHVMQVSLPSRYLLECSVCGKRIEYIETVACHDAKQMSDVAIEFNTEKEVQHIVFIP